MLDVVGETLEGLVLKGAPKDTTLEASLEAYTKPNLVKLAETNDFDIKKSWNKAQMIEVIGEGLRNSLDARFEDFKAEELNALREMLDGYTEEADLNREVVSKAVNQGLLYVADTEGGQITMPAEFQETLDQAIAVEEPEKEPAEKTVKPPVRTAPFIRRPQRRQPVQQRIVGKKVGRNEPCPCGSGKKYKKCCWRKDQKRA